MAKAIKCMKCGHPLTNARSISLGVGPECEKWRSEFIAGCGSSDDELVAIQNSADQTVNRWARNFYVEMANKNTRRAKRCLEAARHAMKSQSQEAKEEVYYV